MANTREDIKSAVGPGLSLQASSNSPALTSQPDKKTISATILFTDIVDSTGLAANLGNRRWSEIVAGYYEVVHREVNANSGKVIHGAGDGFLVVFDAPTRAINCARAIRDDIRNLALESRSGLHCGEFKDLGSDIAGIAVHIAARVAATARPGEVLVTSTIRELLIGSDVQFSDRGIHKLKGVPQEWHLYCADALNPEAQSENLQKSGLDRVLSGVRLALGHHWRSATFCSLIVLSILVTTIVFTRHRSQIPRQFPTSIQSPQQLAGSAAVPSLAVLPFVNLSGDPNQEYFSDGITDELITMLSRLSHILVISRTSTFAYKDKQVKAPQIGRELGAKYLLEGSARKSNNQVRVEARLVEAQIGAEMWAGHFDRPLDEIFAVQDQIVRTIVTTLDLQMSLLERGVWQRVRLTTNNTEAL